MPKKKKTTKVEETKKDPLRNYMEILNSFIENCNAYSSYFSSALKMIDHDITKEVSNRSEIFERKKHDNPENMNLLIKNMKRFYEKIEIYRIIPKSILLMLIASFDLFFSRLLIEIILDKEEIQKGIDKSLSFKDITNYKNVDEIKKNVVHEYVEELMRKSHREQIEWLEHYLKIKNMTGFKDYKHFLLLMEVRNITAHNDSVVNSIFLNNLKKYDIPEKIRVDFELNKKFEINPKYLYDSMNLLIHFAIFIYIRLLRKIYKESNDFVDKHINEICYEYLQERRYNLVVSILEERLNSTDKFLSETKYLYLINLCIAYKKLKNNEKVDELLSKEDWSNCDSRFMLAKAVLENNEFEYIKYMKELKGEIEEIEYREWPLFEEIKKKRKFKNTFKEIFGKDFVDNLEKTKIAEMFKESKKIEQEVSESLESEKLVSKTVSNIDEDEK